MASKTSRRVSLAVIVLMFAAGWQPILMLDVADANDNRGSATSKNADTFDTGRIFVAIEGGETIGVEVNPDQVVEDLKLEIAREEKLYWGRQELRLDGLVLEGNQKLAHYKIKPGATLTLTMKSGVEKRLEVIAETPTGKRLTFMAQTQDSVADIRRRIAKQTGTPEEQVRLLLWRRELQDHRPMADYAEDGRITLQTGEPLSSLHDEVEIFVDTLSGSTAPIRISLAATVANLKIRIEETIGIPRDLQKLAFDKLDLRNSNRLCDHGIRAGSHLRMILHSLKVRNSNDVEAFVVAKHTHHPHRAPIFHEAEDVVSQKPEVPLSLYSDHRNWDFNRAKSLVQNLWFDPVAYAHDYLYGLQGLQPSSSGERNLNSSKVKRASATMANISASQLSQDLMSKRKIDMPGIQVGGSWRPGELLNENLNNYAPDAFSDAELAHLFELIDRVRERMHDLRADEGLIDLTEQRGINREVYAAYRDALAEAPLVEEDAQPVVGEKCYVCHDNLDVEPSVKLPCDHHIHRDCALEWARQMNRNTNVLIPRCPTCSRHFRVPFEETQWTW